MSVDKKRLELESIIGKINKKRSDSSKVEDSKSIVSGTELLESKALSYIPTGISQLDRDLGGGFAKGYISAITGPTNIGKSGLCVEAVIQAQKQGDIPVWVATEDFPRALAIARGVDMDNLYVISSADYGEITIDTLYDILYDNEKKHSRGIAGLVIIDSINALIPKADVDAQKNNGLEGQNQPGRRAAMLSKVLEAIIGRGMLANKTAIILTAHEHVVMGGRVINGIVPVQMSGGKTVEYLSKVIMRLTKMATAKLKEGAHEQVIGHTVKYDITKNHVTGILRKGDYALKHMVGIDNTEAIWNEARHEDFGIITTKRVDKKMVVVFNVLPEVIEFTGTLANAQKFHKENRDLHKKLEDRILALKGVKKKDRAQFLLDTTPDVTIVGMLATDEVSEAIPDVDSEEDSGSPESEE